MRYTNILFFICVLRFLYGCTDADQGADQNFKKISLQQCVIHTDKFQSYFEKNVTPIITLAETRIEEISSVIDANMTNELSRYPNIFRQCNIKQTSKEEVSEINFSYLTMDIDISYGGYRCSAIIRYSDIKWSREIHEDRLRKYSEGTS